jgi:predicted nucleic acid-binding protein
MSDRVFFDTNVLVYVVGQKDERTPIADELVAKGGVISVQVLNELTSVSRRKLGMSWEEIGEALAAIRVLCPSPMPLTMDTHDAGVHIAAKYGFQFYDALIAAAALEAECTTLYSEDFQDGQRIEDRLTVRNPFVGNAGRAASTKSQNRRRTKSQ